MRILTVVSRLVRSPDNTGNMAAVASAARDIPQVPLSRDNLTAVAAHGDTATVTRSQTLPTPPNSISPALPAHGLRAQLQKAKLEPIDSDLDLQDGADGRAPSLSPAFESPGAITSAMLAKHHLPDILLNHGPLAIRHIMGYLTTSVPGFSGIPPTKARRLVVGALEGRGGDGGSMEGEVQYEKVGWGRWNARQREQVKRGTPPSEPSSYLGGIPISNRGAVGPDRAKLGISCGADSLHFSHQDDHDIPMMGDVADNMSMDGSASASCSEAPDDYMDMDDDPDDATDDEDWAAMGAAALRAESYPTLGATDSGIKLLFGATRSSSATAGMAPPSQPPNIEFSAMAAASDAQEREAVEALLRLGSV